MKKWLCLALTAMLFCSPLQSVFAEDDMFGGYIGEELPEEIEGDTGLPEEIEAALPEPVPEPAMEQPGDEEPAADAIEYARVIAEQGMVCSDAALSTPFVTLAREGIVLVVEREEDRLFVAFNSERGVVTGYMDAASVQALNADEYQFFMGELAVSGSATLYEEDLNRPLTSPDCAFLDAATETAEDAEAQQPEAPQDEQQPEAPQDEQQPETVPEPQQPEEAQSEQQPEVVPEAQPAETTVDQPTEAVPETQPPAEANQEQAPGQESEQTQASAEAQTPELAEDSTGTDFTVELMAEPDGENTEAQADAVMAPSEAEDATAEQTVATPEESVEPEPEVDNSVPTDLVLSSTSLSIGIKEEYKLLTATLVPEGSVGTVTWRSSKPKVVKVDGQTGVLTGVKKGSAIVYARLDNGIEKSCKVTVKNAPDKVTLNSKSLEISIGQSLQLNPSLPSGTASAVTYTSSNSDVVSVEKNTGIIKGLKSGFATITATTFNGKKVKCTVAVLGEPAQVFLPESLTIAQAEHKKVSATVVDASGAKSYANYTFYADDGTGSITIDPATGEAVGVNIGTATVRVTTHNGVSTHHEGSDQVVTVCNVTVVEGPERIELSENSITIGLNQTKKIEAVLVSAEGNTLEGGYTVTSSAPKKLKVNSKGQVTGAAKGSYTVTVKAYNGVSATCKVKVVNAPSRVTLKPAKPVIGVGQSMYLTAKYPNGSMGSCTFSSSAKKIVSVDKNGKIKGLKQGTAVITATTHNGKKGTVTVTVTRGPSYVSLNADYSMVYDPFANSYSTLYTKTLDPGNTFQITCQNEYKTYGDIAGYESQNTDVAEVSADGLVTARNPGKATIIVRSTSGAETMLEVTVTGSQPASLVFATGSAALQPGQSVGVPALKGTNISASAMAEANYVSSDENIFTVAWSEADAQWMIRGVNPGQATLMGFAGGAVAQLAVTVNPAAQPAEIHFEDSLTYMYVGDSFTPRVADEYDNTVSATLISDNPGVVNVTGADTLTAVAEGDATVTASLQELTATMTVHVRSGATVLTLESDSLKLGVGQRHALKVQVNGETTTSNLSFSSSDTAVATVGKTGRVIARGVGSAAITVTASGGGAAICQVTVGPAPTRVSIEPAEINACLGDGDVQLKTSFGAPDEMGVVSYASSDTAVADVNGTGSVSFKGVGTATVTATTNNGLSASIPVIVLPSKPVSSTPSYRLFAAYSYFNSNYKGYLPFTKNNATSMASTFGKSSISGLSYSTKVMGNPSKTQLLSGISSFFSRTADNDVSIVYLCSHGHMSENYTGYRMSLPGYDDNPGNANYYLSSQEIMNCVSRINGNVVLILDSCYSGAFLEDMAGRLDAMDGRIAVLTAASDTRATYYNVKDTNKAVDFFSFFLMQGLGYNAREGWWNSNAKGSKGKYPGYLGADKAGNGDGIVTLGEFYDYASKCIATNIPNYMKKKWYWGDKSRVQVSRYYAGNLDNLVIYQPM